MVGTGKLSRVPWCKFHDSWFLEYLTINILIFDFELLQANLHFLLQQQQQQQQTTGKRNHLAHFGYFHYVIKYLMCDVMNYHCLRVFRSRDRQESTRPDFPGCVPNQSAWLFRC